MFSFGKFVFFGMILPIKQSRAKYSAASERDCSKSGISSINIMNRSNRALQLHDFRIVHGGLDQGFLIQLFFTH